MIKSKQNTKHSRLSSYYGFLGNAYCKRIALLLTVSVLLLSACATKPVGPEYNDMYEVRQYQIETVTNEIVTTVFIAKYVETNKAVKAEKEVEDFGGYEFEYSETNTKNFVDSEKPFGDTQIEFQCVDGSCEVKK